MSIDHEEIVEKAMRKVIGDDLHGEEFYNMDMLEILKDYLLDYSKVVNDSKEEFSDVEKINNVNRYMKENVSLNKTYFDAMKQNLQIENSQLRYRTAFSAFFEKEAICVGFSEATRLLLEVNGIDTETHLAALPDTHYELETGQKRLKPFFHYLTVANYKSEDGKEHKVVLDPERQANRERKGEDFEEYMRKKVYIVEKAPDEFIENKVGKNGLGEQTSNIIDLDMKKIDEKYNLVTNLDDIQKDIKEV